MRTWTQTDNNSPLYFRTVAEKKSDTKPFKKTLTQCLTSKVYGYTVMFSIIFAKGENFVTNFLLASLDSKTLPEKVVVVVVLLFYVHG